MRFPRRITNTCTNIKECGWCVGKCERVPSHNQRLGWRLHNYNGTCASALVSAQQIKINISAISSLK